MKQCKLMLMLALLFVAMGSFAQTTVEFVASVDKGSQSKYKNVFDVADKVVKDGVTMSGNNATFNAGDKYSVKNHGLDKQLTFSYAKNIEKIEFVDGEKLSNLSANGFEATADATAATWTGKATSVTFTVKGEAKYAKAIVTIQSKDATTLSFAESTGMVYTDFETHYALPALTLKQGDNELMGQTFTIKSLNPDIVTIGANNEVTPLKAGTATIEATFAGTDAYEGSTATMTLNVAESKNIFHESFDKLDGQGGNDGNWNLTSISGALDTKDCDNAGWRNWGLVYKASQCVRVEMSASLTTPALANLSGDAVVIFRAGQNRGAGTSVNLGISGGGSLLTNSVQLEKGAFNTYVVVVKDATPQTRISFSCSATGCFYLDDVRVEKVVYLDENTNNDALLDDHNLEEVNIAVNRTFTAGAWGTICLPFDVEPDQVATLFGEGTILKELSGWDGGELTLSFSDAKQGIVAGYPYLIKPTSVAQPIVALNTLLVNTEGYMWVSGGIQFIGTFSPATLDDDDAFLGYDSEAGVSKLFNPDSSQENGNVLRGFRAYFVGIDNVSDVKVNVDGVVTGIDSVMGGDTVSANTAVYTLGGQYVGNSTRGLAKGVYVAGGKKIVVK